MIRSTLLAAALAAAAPAADRPNIVLILADDFGYENLGCNGGQSFATPEIDRLAAQGVRFTECYAQPLCTPSRVQLMTGLYNFRNYVGFGGLAPGTRTVGNMLRDAGYTTAMVGKWQLGGDAATPGACGFDRWNLWQLLRKTERYWDPQEFWQDGVRQPDQPGAYGPDLQQRFALDFISANRDRPFLLYYAHLLTHDPFHSAPPDRAAHRGVQAQFGSMVAHFDRQVGELAAHLRALGIERDTLLVVTGDNGNPREVATRLDGAEIRGGKAAATRAGTHVPLVVSWPGTAPARVCDDLVDFTDILPTTAEAARTDPGATDGRSFLPQVRGAAGDPRSAVYGWYDGSDKKLGTAVWAHDGRHALYADGRLVDWRTGAAAEGPAAAAARPRLQAVIDGYAAPAPGRAARPRE